MYCKNKLIHFGVNEQIFFLFYQLGSFTLNVHLHHKINNRLKNLLENDI